MTLSHFPRNSTEAENILYPFPPSSRTSLGVAKVRAYFAICGPLFVKYEEFAVLNNETEFTELTAKHCERK